MFVALLSMTTARAQFSNESTYNRDVVDAVFWWIFNSLDEYEKRLRILETKSERVDDTDKSPAGVYAVDLGLSVKWASCNVGASKPEEYGDYVSWGETEGYLAGKRNFSISEYKYGTNGSLWGMSKYTFPDGNYNAIWYDGERNFIGDNRRTLGSEDDFATQQWGSKWRMPTRKEWEQLMKACEWEEDTVNNVPGKRGVAKNGFSIFLPYGGRRNNTNYGHEKRLATYWTSSLDTGESCSATFMEVSPDSLSLQTTYRPCGLSVRAVCR